MLSVDVLFIISWAIADEAVLNHLCKMASLKTFEATESKFDVIINDVQSLQSETFSFTLRSISWRIQIEKASNCDGDNINVHLECVTENKNRMFGCIAMALVQLKSFDERVPSHMGRIGPHEFSRLSLKSSLAPLVKCDVLYDPAKRFVQENRIQLEIMVKADDWKVLLEPKVLPVVIPEILKPSTLNNLVESNQVHKRLVFEKIEKSLAVISSEFIVFGFPLRIQVFKNKSLNDQNDSSLSVYLWNWRKLDRGGEKVSIQAKVKLLSTDTKDPSFERNTGVVEIGKIGRAGFQHFMTWQQLEAKYIKANGSISMDVDITKVNPKPEEVKRSLSPNPGPSTSHDIQPNKIMKLEVQVKCECCFENMERKTLFRIHCGHLYCQECIDNDLNTRKACVNCDRPNDLSASPQMILFG